MCNKTKILLALRADIGFVAKPIGYLMIESRWKGMKTRHSEEQKTTTGEY